MRRYLSRLLLIFLLLAIPVASAAAKNLPEEQLATNAGSFLVLLDEGRFEEAWLAMSELFRYTNDQQRWQLHKEVVRNAYGQLLTRKELRTSYRKTYRNSPDGDYMIIQYASVFEYKASAVETVVIDFKNFPVCSIREYVIN